MTEHSRRWVLSAGAGLGAAAAVALYGHEVSGQVPENPVLENAAAGERTTGLPTQFSRHILDTVIFGRAGSEHAHAFSGTASRAVAGSLAQPARVLDPSTPAGVWGGTMRFVLACDPAHVTYVTTKLWGGEFGNLGRLMLFSNGEQVGHFHLGPVDPIDIAGDSPRSPGRFFFHTLPLPPALTRGRTKIELEIRSMGSIWGYGVNAAQYYKPMAGPTRKIYRVYTHTNPGFVPPPGDVVGWRPAHPAKRVTPGSEVAAAIAVRVQKNVTGLLIGVAANYDPWQMLELAKAYGTTGTPASGNARALDQLVAAMDGQYLRYLANPKSVIESSPQQWAGLGRVGQVLVLVGDKLKGALGQPVAGDVGITRSAAYAEMLIASRDHYRQHFPQYTNQTMIAALGIYLCNRGLSVIAPGRALPEKKARSYVYQAVGLTPWLGSEAADGTPSKPLGDAYYTVTRKGLTRELSYVGKYGEVTDWLCQLYEAVTGHHGPADAALRCHMIKMIRARSVFRYPEVDDAGFKAMRLETLIGWRDTDYPGPMTYGQRFSWDGHPLQAATTFAGDATVAGFAWQMVFDHQLYAEALWLRDFHSTRVNLNAFSFVADHAGFRSLPDHNHRLPMTQGRPDFVFTDEETGTVAIKRGEERLFVSLFYRTINAGINNLARVHLLTPTYSHSGTIAQQTTFVDSGKTTTVPDWVNMAFANGGIAPPGAKLHQANAGELQPLAVTPYGGTPGPFSGRGNFYRCVYGRYLIAMNTTTGSTYSLHTEGAGTAVNLVNGQRVVLGTVLSVKPLTTVVLYLPV